MIDPYLRKTLTDPCPFPEKVPFSDLTFDKTVTNWLMLIPLSFKVIIERQTGYILTDTRVVSYWEEDETIRAHRAQMRCKEHDVGSCHFHYHVSWLLADLPKDFYTQRDESVAKRAEGYFI